MKSDLKNILTFVIPWYGIDLNGGAENLCRRTVENLANNGITVEVFTTCSKEFLSDWSSNFYDEGKYDVNGITVRRFSVDSRDVSLFDSINYKLINRIAITEEEESQFFKNNINSHQMMSSILKEKDKRIYIFLPYLYGTTFFGVQICPEKSLMIPCLHDESYAYMKIFKKAITNVKGLIFNSTPEKLLAEKIYGKIPPNQVLGIGVDDISGCNPEKFKNKHKLEKFLLYTGRKDPQKNLHTLIDYFCKYMDRNGPKFDLVLTGSGEIKIPSKYSNHIKSLFLSKEDLNDAYSAAFLTCQPSLNESFSFSIMESWLCSTPVLVHGNCAVTTDHCIKSNGGLYFTNYEEFEECINYFLENPDESKIMALNGKNYVLNNFEWKKIVDKYISFITKLFLT
ncbi:MAG: glycosyltransferase [Thaumarchaeota archaeon]|nr:glycosyltransferase [Nitrososphaerota archaeon]